MLASERACGCLQALGYSDFLITLVPILYSRVSSTSSLTAQQDQAAHLQTSNANVHAPVHLRAEVYPFYILHLNSSRNTTRSDLRSTKQLRSTKRNTTRSDLRSTKQVLAGKDLKAMDRGGTSDPYVVLQVGDSRCQTKVCLSL